MNQWLSTIGPAKRNGPWLALSLMLVFCWQLPVRADTSLPLLGEDAAINIEQERKMGAEFYQRLLQRGVIETNPLLNRYLNELGERLLSGLGNRARSYTFFIVKDFGVNAFAVPGGFIGVNIGLILRAQNQDQLASVLAHEIAHVRLMHSLQLMKKAEGVGSAAMLSILAGMVLGGYDAELGHALIIGSAAGSQQAIVNFTRENEYEADRLGIELLQNGGFNAQGMVDFFRSMQRIAGSSEFQNIEYLRTHPINTNRISEAQSRVRQAARSQQHPDYFPMFRDYLEFYSADRLEPRGSPYRKALAQIKLGQYDQADRMLAALYRRESENIWYGYAYAENLENLHRTDAAEQVYRELLQIFPQQFALSMRLIRLLMSNENFEAALVVARRLEKDYPRDKSIYLELSEIYRKLNRPVFQMMAEAEYHRLAGNPGLALKLYNSVIETGQADLATESRARARRDAIDRKLSE